MMYPNALLILILSCIISTSLATKYEFFTKEWTFKREPDATMDYRTVFGKNNDFVYLFCEKNTNCTLVRNEIDINGLIFKDRCLLPHTYSDGHVLFVNSAYGNKILVSFVDIDGVNRSTNKWQANIFHKLYDIATCQYTVNKILIDITYEKPSEMEKLGSEIFWPQTVHYEDGSYDLFHVTNECNGARCKYHVNNEGKIVDPPMSYLPREYLLYKLKVHSTGEKDKSFVVVTHLLKIPSREPTVKNYETFIFYVNKDNHEEILHLDDKPRLLAVDDSNKIFSFCWADIGNPTDLHCSQYDGNKNLIREQIISLPYGVENVIIKNQLNGDFLLLTEEKRTQKKFYLRNIKKVGNNSRNLEIEDFTESKIGVLKPFGYFEKNLHILINLDDKEVVCVSLGLQVQPNEDLKWKIFRKCFPKNVFNIEELS